VLVSPSSLGEAWLGPETRVFQPICRATVELPLPEEADAEVVRHLEQDAPAENYLR
jgi:hypothetical protein